MNNNDVVGVVIDASHGGEDIGNTGNGIVEKEWNLEISNYIFNRLKELGIPVKMIRETDETINNEDRIKKILEAFGNNSNVVVISNHLNSGSNTGVEVLYALRNNSTLSKKIVDEMLRSGFDANKFYQRRLPGDTSKDFYFLLRDTGNTQPIMIKYGTVDNSEDAQSLLNNYQEYGEAVVRALAQYLNFKYVPKEGETIYIVESGDDLWGISKKLGVSVADLKSYNNLKSDNLQVGQILLVPTNTENNIYTVKSGDNLFKIASEFGVSVSDLMQANNLENDSLYIGQKLIIPEKKAEHPNPTYIEYVVKNKDNLWDIANKYNTTVNNIKEFNNLSSNNLSIGQILLIPIRDIVSNGQIVYTVKNGDNLWSIANKYNTTVNEIKAINNLANNNLSIGQKLKIPAY